MTNSCWLYRKNKSSCSEGKYFTSRVIALAPLSPSIPPPSIHPSHSSSFPLSLSSSLKTIIYYVCVYLHTWTNTSHTGSRGDSPLWSQWDKNWGRHTAKWWCSDVERIHQKYWLVDWCRLRKKDSSSLYGRLGYALPRSFISILGGKGNNLKFG